MWALVRAIAEPSVQHWHPLGRFCVHTAIWTAWLTALQYAVLGTVTLLYKLGIKRSAQAPQLSQGRMLLDVTLGYIGWAWPVGAFAAWLNPGAAGGWVWDYSCPNLVVLLYFCLGVLMVYDAYSFFLHRWLHLNKAAFVWLHAKHHEHQAALDTRTAGYMSVMEGLLSDALPLLGIYAAGAATGNWWFSFAGVWNAFHIVMVGHTGADLTLTNPVEMPILLLNPMAYGYLGCSVRATPMEHELHHAFPRRNFSYFFTYWDTLYKTDHKQRPHTTLPVLIVYGLYQFIYLLSHHLLFTYSTASLTWLVVFLMISPAAAAAVAQAIKLPEATRALLGWYMDIYRRDMAITYAPPGSPGAFQTAAATGTVPAKQVENSSQVTQSAADCQPLPGPVALESTPSYGPAAATAGRAAQSQQEKSSTGQAVYLFACHPTGLISRGAFLTFGARGWAGPVSHLPKVRMAIASVLLYIPFPLMRELMLACGCIPADRAGLKRALQSGTSVAMTPGGWRESEYVESYRLVLKRRRGFVELAAETGAHLVPVLCIGEQDVVGRREPLFHLIKWLLPGRPHPVHVVFGEPLIPGTQESVEQLHSRYIQALLLLGQQHGVELSIVE